jgi:hypothetical protein
VVVETDTRIQIAETLQRQVRHDRLAFPPKLPGNGSKAHSCCQGEAAVERRIDCPRNAGAFNSKRLPEGVSLLGRIGKVLR